MIFQTVVGIQYGLAWKRCSCPAIQWCRVFMSFSCLAKHLFPTLTGRCKWTVQIIWLLTNASSQPVKVLQATDGLRSFSSRKFDRQHCRVKEQQCDSLLYLWSLRIRETHVGLEHSALLSETPFNYHSALYLSTIFCIKHFPRSINIGNSVEWNRTAKKQAIRYTTSTLTSGHLSILIPFSSTRLVDFYAWAIHMFTCTLLKWNSSLYFGIIPMLLVAASTIR